MEFTIKYLLGALMESKVMLVVPFLCSSPSAFSFSPLFLFVLLDFPDWVPFHQTFKKVEMLDSEVSACRHSFHSFSICVYSRQMLYGNSRFHCTCFSYFCHGPCFDSNHWCRGHHHISISSPKNPCKTLAHDRRCKGFKKGNNIQRMLQRKQKQKSAEIPARCSIFKCSSEVQPHRDSSPSGKAKKMPCNPSKEKKKEVKQGIREGLPRAQGETLASSTVDSNVLTIHDLSSHYLVPCWVMSLVKS